MGTFCLLPRLFILNKLGRIVPSVNSTVHLHIRLPFPVHTAFVQVPCPLRFKSIMIIFEAAFDPRWQPGVTKKSAEFRQSQFFLSTTFLEFILWLAVCDWSILMTSKNLSFSHLCVFSLYDTLNLWLCKSLTLSVHSPLCLYTERPPV